MEAIGQLTGGIAHDFNNLLTVISGNLETLQRRLADATDGGLDRFVDSALTVPRARRSLTHQLLAFSRRQPLEPKSVIVNALVAAHVGAAAPHLRRERSRSRPCSPAACGPSYVDANQLENCLLNLAVNARDAMPDGGKLTIEAANVYLDEHTPRPAMSRRANMSAYSSATPAPA